MGQRRHGPAGARIRTLFIDLFEEDKEEAALSARARKLGAGTSPRMNKRLSSEKLSKNPGERGCLAHSFGPAVERLRPGAGGTPTLPGFLTLCEAEGRKKLKKRSNEPS